MINFPNKVGFPIFASGHRVPLTTVGLYTNYPAIAAAGRSISIVGNICLEGGSGSKTISSAGGQIFIGKVASRTFSNVGTTLRVGLQNVGATGIETGTFDVYTDLIPPATLGTNSMWQYIMSAGTKTVTHGDLVAVSLELITRAGSDTITFAGNTSQVYSKPYSTVDTSGTPTKGSSTTMLAICIVFDDGSIGWIEGAPFGIVQGFTPVDIAGTGANEEAGIEFQTPFAFTLSRVMYDVSSVNTSFGTFSVDIYEDPRGVATLLSSTTVVAANMYTSDGISNLKLSTSVPITANTKYGIVLRNLDTANAFLLIRSEFGHQGGIRAHILGSKITAIDRTAHSGSFVLTDSTGLPAIGFYVDGMADPASGGGDPVSDNIYTF